MTRYFDQKLTSFGLVVRAFELMYVLLCKDLHNSKRSSIYGFRKKVLVQISNIEAARLILRAMISSDCEVKNLSVSAAIDAQPEAIFFSAEADRAKDHSVRVYAGCCVTATLHMEATLTPYLDSLGLIHSGLVQILQKMK